MVSSFEAAKIRIHGQLILRTRVLRPAALLVSGFQSGPVFFTSVFCKQIRLYG